MILPVEQPSRRFQFDRDTFAFANDLVWQYRLDPVTGSMNGFPRESTPAYSHRCFVMIRAVRQFFYHALFDPAMPLAEPETYRKLIREVVARSPRQQGLETDRIVIPGYDGLRSFSRAHEPLLKSLCGSAWESYFVRSHWRMVFPVWRRHQERMAQQLVRSITARRVALAHLFRFPRITINHGIVLFGSTESDQDIQFEVYDPNIPERPLTLVYGRATRTFSFPQTHYWAGGALNVYEMYIGGLY
jgi:hypothetical protein